MMAGWIQHPPTPSRSSSTASHVRSYSTAPRTTSGSVTPNRVSRAISTSALHTMSGASTSLNRSSVSPSRISSYNDDDDNMSTIPDPRSRTMSPANGASPLGPSHHPDLNDEVATLSTKLINAINHQTSLDDTLNATRHELDSSRERIEKLEREAEEHRKLVASGLLIQSSVAQAEKSKILLSLSDEKAKRGDVEKEKKQIEQELENLTAALFEEANKMVITAREEAQREQELVQRRNDQLKAQLEDTETLLKSHQEQLAELKQVMEQMSTEFDDQTNPTAPSTPSYGKFVAKEESKDISSAITSTPGAGDVSPSYPTSFTHLLHPVLRTDLAAYDDFTSLLRMSKTINAGSRTSSGSYGGLGLNLGLGSSASQGQSMSTVFHHQTPSNGSTTSLTSGGLSSPVTPTTPASITSNSSAPGRDTQIALKETRFYKRALAEDIEPTLRLDIAPGLSWLARRSVLTAMSDGTLVVEPMPTPSTMAQKLYTFACSLCGESRKDKDHARTHRFRTSESETAQRYPLCKYCLGRVRSSCDFMGFLRMLKDGYWRTDDEESEKSAWEESVRLREQMFWCRMGGGVVPWNNANSQMQEKSPRASDELDMIKELEQTGEIKPRDITPIFDRPLASNAETDVGGDASTSGNMTSKESGAIDGAAVEQKSQQEETVGLPEEVKEVSEDGTKEEAKRVSTQSLQSVGSAIVGKKEEQRLSLTIPGASE